MSREQLKIENCSRLDAQNSQQKNKLINNNNNN